jgi:hypothetical protein
MKRKFFDTPKDRGKFKKPYKKPQDFGPAARKTPVLWTTEQNLRHLQMVAITVAVMETRRR